MLHNKLKHSEIVQEKKKTRTRKKEQLGSEAIRFKSDGPMKYLQFLMKHNKYFLQSYMSLQFSNRNSMSQRSQRKYNINISPKAHGEVDIYI